MPGVSRSRATEKRAATLGVEFKKRLKKNKFVDERFGAGDETMTAEDKMMRRFTLERQKHHSKHSAFNLDDTEEFLTHKGQNIDEIEEFGDVYHSDSDDDVKGGDNTTGLHFGGFLEKGKGTDVHKSGKDVMDEIVAKSKMLKAERQKDKEESTEVTDLLDKDWTALQALMGPSLHPSRQTERDDYDTTVKELVFEAKAKPTDRMKSEEELAKETRDRLEDLEKKRLQRMKVEGDKDKETSADALLTLKSKAKVEKVMISYDAEGKMQEPEGFDEALQVLREGIAQRKEEESSECESGDEDDEEEGEEEEESDDEEDEEDQTLDNVPQFSVNHDVEGEDGNCLFDEVTEESDNITKIDNVPFLLEVPEHINDFTALVTDKDDDTIVSIIKRIIASNHPTLKEENKAQIAGFYVILLKYLVQRFKARTLSALLLDSSCTALFSVTKHVSTELYNHLYAVVLELKERVTKNTGKNLSAVITPRLLVYFYMISKIYPTTDYKHAIVSPVLLSISWAMSSCSVRKIADIKIGLFLSGLLLEYSVIAKKYNAEMVYWLTQVMTSVTTNSKVHEYVTNFKIKQQDFIIDDDQSSVAPKPLRLMEIYSSEKSERIPVLFTLLKTCHRTMKMYFNYTAFDSVFRTLHSRITMIPLDNYHKDFTSLTTLISSDYERFSNKLMPFLRYENQKPRSIKMLEPKFDMVFIDKRGASSGPNKEENEHKELKKKLKSEMKGAIREIKKDNKFISRMKHKDQAKKDKTRKRKVGEIMGFLSKEQGEANDLKYQKKRDGK